MKKIIIVVDDEIIYLEGILKTLEYMINNQKNINKLSSSKDEYKIVFFNIIWTTDSKIREESCKKIIKKVENRITSREDFEFVPIDVYCMELDKDTYKKNPREVADIVLEKQEELLAEYSNSENCSYAVLIDVVLNLFVDSGWLEIGSKAKKKPLSYHLAKHYSHEKCIIYTKYTEYNHGKQWKNLIKWPELPLSRFIISEGNEARSYKEKLFSILSANN